MASFSSGLLPDSVAIPLPLQVFWVGVISSVISLASADIDVTNGLFCGVVKLSGSSVGLAEGSA